MQSDKGPALRRKNLLQIQKKNPKEQIIVDTCINNPAWGKRTIKSQVEGAPSETSIRNILSKYDLSTIQDRVIANYIVNKHPLNSSIKHPSPHKYDKNLTTSFVLPEKIQRHHINRILGLVTPNKQNSKIIPYPGCIWYFSCRNISNLINSEIDIYELFILDHFSHFIPAYQLIPVKNLNDFDRIFSRFFTNSCSPLFKLYPSSQLIILDLEQTLPASSTTTTIAKRYKLKPKIQRALWGFSQDYIRIFHSLNSKNKATFFFPVSTFLNQITDDLYLRWVNRNTNIDTENSPVLKKLLQAFERYISNYNVTSQCRKFCYGRSPQTTFQDSTWLVPEKEPSSSVTTAELTNRAQIGGLNLYHKHNSRNICECPHCLQIREVLEKFMKSNCAF